jgi:hypothetical protein
MYLSSEVRDVHVRVLQVRDQHEVVVDDQVGDEVEEHDFAESCHKQTVAPS